jgi:drug/metabolite transporter (DMT)-like permease
VGHPSIPRTRLAGALLTLAGVIVVSPDSVLIRLINADMWTILMCRSLLGAVGLLAISVVMEKPMGLNGFRRIGIPGLVLSASYVGCTMCFVYAVTHTTVANALVIMSISPVLGALMSRVVLGEPVGGRTWLGATVILLGLIVIFRNSLNTGSINGDAAALGAALPSGDQVCDRPRI